MTRESLVDVKDFKAYLFVISKNRAINALKKSLADLERMKKYASEVPFNEQPEDEDNDSQLHFSLIDEAIDQLSPRQKEIFLLHRHERYSYREIAEQLGIGKESVKTHLSLAIKSIKNHIETKITLIILLIDFISKKSD
jgi:RNA polymerase sigma-70 factor (ECF subfamily)